MDKENNFPQHIVFRIRSDHIGTGRRREVKKRERVRPPLTLGAARCLSRLAKFAPILLELNLDKTLKIKRRPAVEAKTGLSRSTIYEKIKDGTFPKPVKLGPRAVGWFDSEIDAWLEERLAQRGEV